ncbi:unnamed protein product [Allacma fusca]|uniref:Uncharacterized protein n=1 Tax=Allacma fusca TaxID=39272 RepID=A0A8J2NIU6_9HEXA|nr:unnamed protein product [Allacma fusca]
MENKDNLTYTVQNKSSLTNLGKTYNKLIQDTSKDHDWGDEANIVIASAIINRPIDIIPILDSGIMSARMRYNINPAVEHRRPLQLVLYKKHFQPLLRLSYDEAPVPIDGVYNNCIDSDFRIHIDAEGRPVLEDVGAAFSKIFSDMELGDDDEHSETRYCDDRWNKLTASDNNAKDKSKSPSNVVEPSGTAKEQAASSSASSTCISSKAFSRTAEDSTEDTGEHLPTLTIATTNDRDRVRSLEKGDVNQSAMTEKVQTPTSVEGADDRRDDVTDSSSSPCSPVDTVDCDKLKLKKISSRNLLKTLGDKVDGLAKQFNSMFIKKPDDDISFSSQSTKSTESLTMTTARSVEDILKTYYCLETRCDHREPLTTEEFTSLICNLCFDENKRSSVGEFKYSSKKGTHFKTKEKQPRSFINLKKNIMEHMNAPTHLKNANEEEKMVLQRSKTIHNNKVAGMNCGRFAYTCIKDSANYAAYEPHLALANKSGCFVGDINHSRKFCADVRHSVYSKLYERTKCILNTPRKGTGRPPPVGIFADKYTPNRQTGQVVGLVTFLNGNVETLNVGFVPVPDHSPRGLADSILKPINDVIVGNLEKRTVNGAFDGEYFIKKATDVIAESLCHGTDAHWLTLQWDAAHRLELSVKEALGTTSRNSTPTWFSTAILDTVNNVNDKYRFGSRYGELISAEATCQPKSISSHRFASYSHKAIDNFIKNFMYICEDLNYHADPEADNVNHASFVLGLTFSKDLYKIISDVSKTTQRVQMLPWQMNKYVTKSYH